MKSSPSARPSVSALATPLKQPATEPYYHAVGDEVEPSSSRPIAAACRCC
jgi:hypothetical protein